MGPMPYSCFYKFVKGDYSDVSSIMARKKTPLGTCPEPTMGLDTKCGRLMTFGFVFDEESYLERLSAIEIIAKPYYDTWDDVRDAMASCSVLSEDHLTAMGDLLRWGSVELIYGNTFNKVLLFDRIQLYFEKNFDLMVRGCWPCYQNSQHHPVAYIDSTCMMLP